MAKNNVSEIDLMSVMDIRDEIGIMISEENAIYEIAKYIFELEVPYDEIKEAIEKTAEMNSKYKMNLKSMDIKDLIRRWKKYISWK